MATHSSILAWKNTMDRGAWQVIVHGVTKSRTWLSNWACTMLQHSSPDSTQYSWNVEAEAPSLSQDSTFRGSANLSTAQPHTFAYCLQLLTKDPESRLSSLGDVQSAPYLADMNWDAVLEKALTPGFVPNVSEVLPYDIQPCCRVSILGAQEHPRRGQGAGGLAGHIIWAPKGSPFTEIRHGFRPDLHGLVGQLPSL